MLGAEWRALVEGDTPLLICGDFNSGRFSPVYRRLRKDLVDAQRANGKRARATWPSRWPMLRLDHVFASSGLKVAQCEVRRDALSAMASDHLPLVVEFYQ